MNAISAAHVAILVSGITLGYSMHVVPELTYGVIGSLVGGFLLMMMFE